MTAPEIPDSASPFWLRMYGHWIPLQGIMPVVDTDPQRQFSELVTVDGYRYEQRAPRGPRNWVVDYRYATAAATAALEAASYDLPTTTAASGQTLLLDVNHAKVNMLPPEAAEERFLSNVAAKVPIRAGGVWQRSVARTGEPGKLSGGGQIVYVPVRAGVTYTAAVWTTGPTNAVVVAIQQTTPLLPAVYGDANGGGTPENPEMVSVTYTPAVDGEVAVIATSGSTTSTWSTAGLMFFEGDCPPEYYRHGRRMPCQVSVQDAKITNNLIWRYCDPCKLPREHVSFVIHEVGIYPASVVP